MLNPGEAGLMSPLRQVAKLAAKMAQLNRKKPGREGLENPVGQLKGSFRHHIKMVVDVQNVRCIPC